MLRKLALLISVVFQPLLIPSLVFGLILFVAPQASSIPADFKERIFFLLVISTLLIPMVTIIGLRLSGALPSLHMASIRERAIPFSVTSIYYLLTVYFLRQKAEFDPILWQALATITVAIVILTLITFFWKMSAHMTGIGGLLATVIVLGAKFPTFEALYPLLLTLILTGAIGSSRLYLHAHRPIEIYGGFIFGFAVCYVGFNWIWV